VKNIVLTGFMGTGKTAVSAELARLTGFGRVEIDAEIERTAGMSISRIFERFGEPRFREMETEAIKRFARERRLIISTGGGAVMKEENVAALKEGGVIVCLTASPETILKRTSKNAERPLLQVQDPMGRITELLEKRRPFYEAADIMVDTEGKSPRQVAREILERVPRAEG
jgi:shikimate kinase